jgi:hypothetical protein
MRKALRSIAFVLGTELAPAAPAPGLQELTDRTIRDLDLQTDLPRVAAPFDWSVKLPEWFAWLCIGLGVAVLLCWLKDYLPIFRGRGAGDRMVPGDAASRDESYLPRHLDTAEGLAREGRFVEAMHELLLEAVGTVRARLGERLADSLTSREILTKAPLPEPGKSALREIIARVEWTYFGEHPAMHADYLVCRESLDRLSGALNSASPA